MAKSSRKRMRDEKQAAGLDGLDRGEADLRAEKARARELRATRWWKNLVDRGICHYCGRKVDACEITMDHVVPLSRGGKSVKSNIVACCKDCNTKKSGRMPMEWDGDSGPES